MREILERLVKGQISVDEAERLLKVSAIEEIGGLARIDIGREARKGIPEIILAEGKSPGDVAEIAFRMLNERGRAIISRAAKEHMDAIRDMAASHDAALKASDKAGIIVVRRKGFEVGRTSGKVGILTAGTSDIPVAEEARVIVEEMGCEALTAYDVGVAGIHRLFPPLREMVEADVDVLVVAAGREGALPSVVAGLVDIPVIAVPTSTGYGLGEKGVSALTAMLQACSLGIAVVNIDGGVAAGVTAALIANRAARFKKKQDRCSRL